MRRIGGSARLGCGEYAGLARDGFQERQMSGSVNKVILIGNVGRDPEVRRTANGDAIVSF